MNNEVRSAIRLSFEALKLGSPSTRFPRSSTAMSGLNMTVRRSALRVTNMTGALTRCGRTASHFLRHAQILETQATNQKTDAATAGARRATAKLLREAAKELPRG
jgi:hypothetical protein